MEKISFDSGIKEYRINGAGVLRFNPADPNVYARFMEAADKIGAVEQEISSRARQAEDSGAEAVKLMAEADQKIKKILDWVFGENNSFDKLLGGVNLLAAAGNGERVITNLLAALEPILLSGAEQCARRTAEQAVVKAKARRERQ